jgi:probable HAF family extracellular repeat protein
MRHGYLYTGGVMKKIFTPGFPPLNIAPNEVWSTGVNAWGDVVGHYYNQYNGLTRAFVQIDAEGSQMVDLGTLGGNYADARDINAAGQIVGTSYLSSGYSRGYLYQQGAMSPLPTLGGLTGYAHAINERGQITGCATGGDLWQLRAYRYDSATAAMIELHGEDSCGAAINSSGHVAGWFYAAGWMRAFVHDGAALIDVGPQAAATSRAAAINSAGDVVGWYWQPGVSSGGFVYRAEEGTSTALDDLVPAGVHVTDALDINGAGQILVTAEVDGQPGPRVLMLTPTVLDRFAYAYADQPTVAQYQPSAQHSYNASGGAITISRLAQGMYEVKIADLPAWGLNLSSAISVSTAGASRASCVLFSENTTVDSMAAYVTCNDLVTNAAVDSRFLIMVTGNGGVAGPSAFLMSGGALPQISPSFSWNATTIAKQSVTRVATGIYDVLMGTGNTAKSAKLVTASAFPAVTCNYAKGISGGVQVRCYDHQGAAVDSEFTVVQVAGGRPGRRLGYALANLATTPSYTPTAQASFNSSGGAITAARSAVGRYTMTFAGLATPFGGGEHVQVTPMLESIRAACNVVSWQNVGADLQIAVECRNGAGQYLDTRYDVLVIE